jgi:hypothetical protein
VVGGVDDLAPVLGELISLSSIGRRERGTWSRIIISKAAVPTEKEIKRVDPKRQESD